MKTKEIAEKYGIDQVKFEKFLERYQAINKVSITSVGFSSISLKKDVEKYVELYKEYLVEEQKAKEETERQMEEDEEKQRACARMLISSGFSFDGYKIVKYSGYISGDDCITMPRDTFWGNNKVSDNLCGALVKIRRQAIKELKEAAYDLGCNAVVGVDFDYITMDPQHSAALNVMQTVYEPYVICVTANGNAVVIEKIEQ